MIASKSNDTFAVIGLFLMMLLSVGTVSAQETGSSLSVPEYGVGTDVVDRQLEGRAESFTEGSSVVFWTRVTGGRDGDTIQHAWMHEGTEQLVIDLAIGASHWRTYSRKQLHAGMTGSWKVEARDADGNVLASQEFECVPAEDQPEPAE